MARIGLAVSDVTKMLATPLAIVAAEKKLALTVAKIAKEIKSLEEARRCTIDEVVVGLPLRMNGQVGMMADEVNLFIAALQQQLARPVIAWDERLSTVQAERAMLESSMSRKKRAKIVDKVTAVIILQSYLDAQSFNHERSLLTT